jgi:hypothetical protein
MSTSVFSHILQNTFCVFSLNVYMYSLSVFFMQAKIILAYSETTSFVENYQYKSMCSPCTLEDFWRILGRRSNTFGVFSEYDEPLLAYSQNSHKGQRKS